MIVEFIGLPGAGKSTLMQAAKDTWNQLGLKALPASEIGPYYLRRTLLGRIICLITPTKRETWVLNGIYRRFIHLYRVKFALKNPKLAWQVINFILHRPLPWKDKKVILGWFFRDASYYEFYQERLRPEELLLLEEGIVHRATSLYASPVERLDPNQIRRYISALPRPDLIIWIHTSLDTSVERVISRGEQRRYLGKDLRPFIASSAEIIELAMQTVKGVGCDIIQINNDETFRKSKAQLHDLLIERNISYTEPI